MALTGLLGGFFPPLLPSQIILVLDRLDVLIQIPLNQCSHDIIGVAHR